MKMRVASAGLLGTGISSSSLRVGFIAEAVKDGARNPELTAQTGFMDSEFYERFFGQFGRPKTSLDF